MYDFVNIKLFLKVFNKKFTFDSKAPLRDDQRCRFQHTPSRSNARRVDYAMS